MKKRTYVISVCIGIALAAGAQVPRKFNYQAVVRTAQKELVTDQDVGFRLSILEGTANGSPVYVETQHVTTNAYGIANFTIGDGSLVSGAFENIPWGEEPCFLKVEVDPAGGSVYEHVGTTQLVSVPYAVYSANLSSPTRKFTIQENEDHPVDSALFEVRNAEGQTVFAVYPEGTRIFILDEDAKGKKGGFAVGGYSRATKGETSEYMRVTPDSVRIYINNDPGKGKKGGFAVGGYSRTSKSSEPDYLSVFTDSIRFHVGYNPSKGRAGGFAINGISRESGESVTYLFLTPENYFIGEESGRNNTTGQYNTFIGYRAGESNTEGSQNVCWVIRLETGTRSGSIMYSSGTRQVSTTWMATGTCLSDGRLANIMRVAGTMFF